MFDRRDFLKSSGIAVGALAMGPAFWSRALAETPVTVGAGPYGPLGAANPATGVSVPAGFSSRLIANGGVPLGTTGYQFPPAPDGSASYALPDGGWILVSNSEVPGGQGGASSITFGADGAITGARRILGGTSMNCAGGATPWATWLSCEETATGRVFECDPEGVRPAVVRPAMGTFSHEAVCVDPVGRQLYLTEDVQDTAGLYRFTPDAYPDLSRGVLEIAVDAGGGLVDWVALPDPTMTNGVTPTRMQVPGSLRFDRGEGIFFDTGIVYVATTDDDRIYAYDTATERIQVLYDGVALPSAPLHEVDNITTHVLSGDLYAAEDSDDLQVCLITGDRVIAPFLMLTPLMHSGSEVTGVTFNPAGDRMYFSSQRGGGAGMIIEVSGPFRTLSPRVTPVKSVMPGTASSGTASPGTGSPGTASGGPGAAGGGSSGSVPSSRFALRAKPASRLLTIRRKGLATSVDVMAGPVTVRLKAGPTTLAVGRARPTRAGRLRITIRPTKAAATFGRGRLVGTLELRQGSRRVTRPIRLVTPGRTARSTRG